jgi:hypothetical protein
LITWIIVDKTYRYKKFLRQLCNSPLTSILLGHSVFLSTALFSNTFTLRISYNVWAKDSYPHTRTDKL